MADNLTITIGADSARLRAELAVSESSLRAFTREMNAAANAARRSGSDLDFAKVEQLAAKVEEATANVAKLKTELSTVGEGGLLGHGINEGLKGLAELSSRMRETAELAGTMFAADKVKEFVTETAELGERTKNQAWAIGLSVQQYAQLSGALQLAGADSDEAQRTIERLGRSVQSALVNPTGQAAASFHNLGISQEEVKSHANNLIEFLGLLIEKTAQLQPGLQRTGALEEVLARGMDRLAGLFRGGAAGFEELLDKARPFSDAMAQNTGRLDENAEALNQLSLDWQTLKVSIAPAVDFFVGGMDNMINAADAWRNLVESAIGVVDRNFDDLKQKATEAAEAVRDALLSATIPGAGIAADVVGGIRKATTPTHTEAAFPAALPGQYGYEAGGDWSDRPLRPVGTEKGAGGAKKGNEAADIGADYRLDIAMERAKGDATAETAQRVVAIYDQWLAALAAVYGQDSRQYKQVLVEKLNADREYQQRAYEEASRGAIKQVDALKEGLKAFEAAQKTKADLGQISMPQAYAADVGQVGSIAAQAHATLNTLSPLATTAALKEQLAEAQAQVDQWSKATTAQLVQDWTAAAQKIKEAWAAPFKQAFDQIAGAAENALKNIVMARTPKERQQAWQGLDKSLMGSGIDLVGGVASKVGGSLLGGKQGQGFADVIGEKITSWITQTVLQIGATTANTAAVTANTAAQATAATASGAGALSAAGSAGGILGGIKTVGSWVGSLFAFEAGGIVPSAAGGWALPSFAGATPALLHSREMVLPAPISQGIQRAIAGGSFGGGSGRAGDVHLHQHYGPYTDSAQMDRGMKSFVGRNRADLAGLFRGLVPS